MMTSARISRRTLLRGAGAAVALPWLEAMSSPKAAADEETKQPVRLGFFYVPNGVHMSSWRPAKVGELDQLPETAQSLEPVKDKVLILSDLAADHCDGKTASHEPAGGGFLVGKKCKHSEVPEVGGASVDQFAARAIGNETPVDSLALGIDPGHRGDHGYSGTYLSHISWRSKTSPTPLELNPKQLYQRLFRGQPPRRPDWVSGSRALKPPADSVEASVLDLVRDEARSLQRKLGYDDRRKLAEYLEGFAECRETDCLGQRERPIASSGGLRGRSPAQADDPQIPELIIPEGKGIPPVYAEHVNLMLDILILAWQTGYNTHRQLYVLLREIGAFLPRDRCLGLASFDVAPPGKGRESPAADLDQFASHGLVRPHAEADVADPRRREVVAGQRRDLLRIGDQRR